MTLEEMIQIKNERGLSLALLAQYSGVPLGTVQKIFSGATKNPRKATMDALAKVLSGDENLYTGKAYTYQNNGIISASDRVSESISRYGSSLYKPEKRQGEYTVEDYRAFPEDQRMELIDGVLIKMESPTSIHQDIIGIIHYQIRSFIRKNKGNCRVFLSPIDVQLDKDNKTMVVPDLIIVCDPDKVKRFGIYGAPDFILEVLSPTTGKKDCTTKCHKYANAGVREYWIVDPDRKRLIVYDLDHEEWIPEIRPLIGTKGLAIYDGELEIDLEEIRVSIESITE